ncbi:MAG TPA: hypothetical protein VGI75_14200 [Pirellulales bacterium]
MSCQLSQPDSIDCRKFKAELNAALDARANPADDSELCAHADVCPDCADWLQTQSTIFAAIPVHAATSWNEVFAAPPDFALSVLQLIETEKRRERKTRRITVGVLALAAALLIAVLNWQPHQPDAGLTPSPAAPKLTVAADVDPTDLPLSYIVYAEIRAYGLPSTLVQHLSPTYVSAAMKHHRDLALAEFADHIGANRQVLVDGFNQGLRPVTSSVNVALDTLIRTLPGGELPQHVL